MRPISACSSGTRVLARSGALAALCALLLCTGSPTAADPEFGPIATNLFEVLEEGNGVCSHAGDPDCVKGPTVRRTRRIRLRTELLLALEPGAVRLVRFNLMPGIEPTGWILAGETGKHGFVQWRAALDGDPLAWVGIFASPLPPPPLAMPPPAPVAASALRAERLRDVAAHAPDDEPGTKEKPAPEPTPLGGHALVPGGGPPLEPGNNPLGLPLTKVAPAGRSFLVSISSPRYGDYQVRGGLAPAGTASVGVVTHLDHTGLLACGMGDDPSKRGRGQRGGRCCCCQGCCRCRSATPGPRGAGDKPLADGSVHFGPVGDPGNLTTTDVTLLVLYTEEALGIIQGLIVAPDTAEGAMDVTLADAVGRTNLALQRSATGIVIDWVRPAVPWVLSYPQEANQSVPEIQASLKAGQTTDFKSVHALRDELRADLVSLVIGKRGAYPCGWGDIYDVDASEAANAVNAFNVVRFDCLADHSLSHEVAHAFGCCHDQGDTVLTCKGPDYRYAHWFYDFRNAQWSTVMGVLGGRRVLGYSNPDLSFNATPDLDSRHVKFGAESANNARMIREYGPKVATYR